MALKYLLLMRTIWCGHLVSFNWLRWWLNPFVQSAISWTEVWSSCSAAFGRYNIYFLQICLGYTCLRKRYFVGNTSVSYDTLTIYSVAVEGKRIAFVLEWKMHWFYMRRRRPAQLIEMYFHPISVIVCWKKYSLSLSLGSCYGAMNLSKKLTMEIWMSFVNPNYMCSFFVISALFAISCYVKAC